MISAITLLNFAIWNAVRGGNILPGAKPYSKYIAYAVMGFNIAWLGFNNHTDSWMNGIQLFIIATSGIWLMMVIAGSKYFPHGMDTSTEPPSLAIVGKLIEATVAHFATVQSRPWKAACLGLTKMITSIPLFVGLAVYFSNPLILAYLPLMIFQGLAYYIGFIVAEKLGKPQHDGLFAELLNGLLIGGVLWLVIN